MEKAKSAEQAAGATAFPIEPIVMARPFTSPRREASVELLMAKAMAMYSCDGRGVHEKQGRYVDGCENIAYLIWDFFVKKQ